MPGPLSHITAVEMTVAIQGPGAGLFLADMGATVIKVEPPIGDPSRYHRGVRNELPQTAMSSQFVAVNRGKQSVCLDVHTPEGRSAVQELLKSADVFLSNYRRHALERMGLDYASVAALNDRLVYATVNGFGPLGPDADKAMLDGAAIARGGLAAITGTEDGGPMAPGGTVADNTGAMQFALGIVTALLARERTGKGQHVQTSALGAQMWLQQWEMTHEWMTGTHLKRSGAHHPNILGPYGIYRTSDGAHFLFAVALTNEAWDAFWVFADDPAFALDPTWDKPGKRLGTGVTQEDSDVIQERMREVFASKTAAQWQAFLGSQQDIIFERIQNYDDVRDDPQALANGYVQEMDLPVTGKTHIVGNLMRFDKTPVDELVRPPLLGEHTAEVLRAYGVEEDTIAAINERAEQERNRLLAMLIDT